MKAIILFFGATADAVGRRRLELDLQPETTSAAVFERVAEMHPELRGRKLLYSVNQEYAGGSEIINDGDEIAVFTAVSGG